MSECRILLVEDDEDDVLFLRRAFRIVGVVCALDVAEDGARAIAHLDGAIDGAPPRPSGVLLDLKLPRVSGLEVLRWLRAHPHLGDVRVIVLTSSDEPRDIEAVHALGVDAYLVKPVGFDELVARVRAVVAMWGLEAA